MATSAPPITGVDFVTVSATDFPASVHFYGEVLGLPCKQLATAAATAPSSRPAASR